MARKKNNRKVAEYWNYRGETYNKSWQSLAKKNLSNKELNLIRETIENALKNSKRKRLKVLDIGVGTGRISKEILKHKVKYYGIDVSDAMISHCKEKFKGNSKVKKLRVHDILNPIPKSWGKFDLVTAIRVLSYSCQWQKELQSIYNIMEPGGVLIFTFPNKYSSALISKLFVGKSLHGYEVDYGELKKALENVGFLEYDIVGFARLLDTFYDWCDNKFSAKTLLAMEKSLSFIFGSTLFARLFYVVCRK